MLYVNNSKFLTYRLDSLVYSGWSEAMPHVSKPDMKNGWQVVKVLKMEKHPSAKKTNFYQLPLYHCPIRVWFWLNPGLFVVSGCGETQTNLLHFV